MKKDDTSRLITEYLKKGGKITRCKPKLPKDALVTREDKWLGHTATVVHEKDI